MNMEAFFHDDPDLPYQPLPPHELQASPCYAIIYKDDDGFYRCKLHPKIVYEHLNLTIEV
jgi:hypothetical protein